MTTSVKIEIKLTCLKVKLYKRKAPAFARNVLSRFCDTRNIPHPLEVFTIIDYLL